MLKAVVYVLCSLLMVGCSVPFNSSEKDAYLKSKNASKLNVQPPLQSDEISSFYYLPDAEGNKQVSVEP
mgnify:CR=1 FL=1